MADNSTISPLPLGEGPGVRAVSGRKAPNPYLQVALTYLRRPFSSPQGLAVSAGLLLVCIGFSTILLSGDRHDIPGDPMLMLLALAMVLPTMFAIHVKNQFADSRARLMPGFRRVHATVAAAIALLLAVLLPTMLIWLADLRSVGLVALMVFLLGVFLCLATVHSNLWSLLFGLGFLPMFTEPGKMFFWQLLSGRFEVEAFALLGLGTAVALLGGIRLVGLNEDMPAYKQSMCVDWEGRCTNDQTQAGAWMLPPALREWLMENSMARWTSHARCASTSWWSGVRRWQVGISAGRSAFLMVLFAFVGFFFFLIMTSRQNLLNINAVFAMIMLSFMPSCMAWSLFIRWRAPLLARGLLLPVDRRTFVRQVGTAVAIDQLQLWAGMGAGIALWVWLAGPKASSVTDFAVLLGVFTLFQFWFFGLGAWFARYRNFGMQLGGYILGFQVLMAAGGICNGFQVLMADGGICNGTAPWIPWKYMGLCLAGIIAIFGLLLSYDAYRRWLAVDFD